MHPRLALAFACLLLALSAAPAQDRDRPVLRVDGIVPGGLRTSVTESWCTFDFTITNFSDQDRLARVMVFYSDRPDVQYGRDVWVPARASLSTWLLAGPIPPDEEARAQPRPKLRPGGLPPLARRREIQWVLYDRTDGTDRLILPRGEERVRSRVVPYRPREPYTSVLLDHQEFPPRRPGALPPAPLENDDTLTLLRTFRAARELSPVITIAPHTPLPPTPDPFGGIDHFVVAGNRIADDPAGLASLRQWLERGGYVWVMLDRVNLDAVAPLLGDAVDFQVIDRVGLTDFQIDTHAIVRTPGTEVFRQRHERPVDFVRVLLPRDERPRHTIDGYPVWFTRSLGRGTIIFSTLGPRGWHRPRTRQDGPSPYAETFPDLPVPLQALEAVGDQFNPAQEDAFRPEVFERTLTDEIGYRVVSRTTVALVFGGFLLGTLLVGLALRRAGRGELLGWMAPLVALAAAAAFVGLGETSRRQAPPTVAQGQIVDAVSSAPEVAVRGLMALYRPDSGPAPMGAPRGGLFEVDMQGVEGQIRRFVLTDGDAWHWENLSLPAGVRLATFQQAVRTPAPVTAVARFGPEGLEGRLTTAPFEDVEDAMIRTASGWTLGRDLAVRLSSDGRFTCGSGDILPPRQFLASTLLTDLQQRRQDLYRQFLDPAARNKAPAQGSIPVNPTLARKAGAPHLEGKTVLFAWARAIDTHFELVPGARQAGSALLVVPVSFERPAPGTAVTIPGPFVPYRRIRDGLPLRLTSEGTQDIDLHLRFQLPPEVLPLALERVRVNFRIDAPSRRVRVSAVPAAREDGERVEVHSSVSPLDAARADITDARLLRLDEHGGLHLTLELRTADKPDPARKTAGKGAAGRTDEKWTIHHLEIEVAGKTSP